jgi:hypothetical protein
MVLEDFLPSNFTLRDFPDPILWIIWAIVPQNLSLLSRVREVDKLRNKTDILKQKINLILKWMSKYFFYDDCSMAPLDDLIIEWNVVARPHGDEYEYFVCQSHSYYIGNAYKYETYYSIKKGPLTDDFVQDIVCEGSTFIPDWKPYSEEDEWVIYKVQENVLSNIKKVKS